MKNKSLPLLWVVLLICLSCNPNKNLIVAHTIGTSTSEQIKDGERIDGNQLIDSLLTDRFSYNKALIKDGFNSKKQLPKPTAIINNTPLKTISFNGLNYLVKDGKVVDIKGLKLSASALSIITEKLANLDQIQQYCCEKSNLEYQQENRDINTIKTLDRQYFAALNTLKHVTSSIATEARKRNASILLEMSLAKIKLPDIKNLGMKTKRNYVAKIE
ncbi:hypothetical protein ASU31_22660 [Pedobacter ginsenosidimutans]|uniref:DUF4142 domain-containing protein n=1 Tax=Pedobacter ginsenosidimutans TaxID=687842 RepID=A0A0T5VJF8_9SPHI|nr:hypothetical protein [Pedobacter ginsenosidimutans]KRT13759.1 hypothetical protein ASU31_22660 [Pedobacter ginsenosidimutans]